MVCLVDLIRLREERDRRACGGEEAEKGNSVHVMPLVPFYFVVPYN